MRWFVALVLLAIPCCAGEAGKPPCNKQNRGRLWPDQANTDPAALKQAGQRGELQMCTLGAFRYRWQPLTVHVSQLGKGRQVTRHPSAPPPVW